MQVTFPSHHTWLKDTAVSFAGRLGRKIHASLPLLSAEGVSYSIQPLTEIFLKDLILRLRILAKRMLLCWLTRSLM